MYQGLNNLQGLICHKTIPNFQTKPTNYSFTNRTYNHLTVCKQIGDVELNS